MLKIKQFAIYFLALIYISGAIGFSIYPDFFSPFTPLTLVLTTAIYLLYQPYSDSKFLFGFFMIALIGYILEVVGVATGLVFGKYAYGDALGIKLLEVPLIISLNWALMISAGFNISKTIFRSKFLIILCTATITVGIDVLIEQIAVRLDFWEFESGMPGFHNYFGWFIISVLCSSLFYSSLTKGTYKSSIITLILQVMFFGSIYIFY